MGYIGSEESEATSGIPEEIYFHAGASPLGANFYESFAEVIYNKNELFEIDTFLGFGAIREHG